MFNINHYLLGIICGTLCVSKLKEEHSNLFFRNQFKKCLQNVTIMHAGKGLYASPVGNMAVNIRNLLEVQNQFSLSKSLWRTSCLVNGPRLNDRVFFLGQEMHLDFAAWIDLTSNVHNLITVSYWLPSKFQSTFWFLMTKIQVSLTKLYKMPQSQQKVRLQGTLKQCLRY